MKCIGLICSLCLMVMGFQANADSGSDGAGGDLKDKVWTLSEGREPTPSTLDDLAWMEGTWVGSRGPGHTVQHVILAEEVGHMPGFVRSWQGDTVLFYEITTFAEVGDHVAYRVKHFNYDLTGWEEREQVIHRPLLGKGKGMLRFNGITFEQTDEDSFTVYFRIPEGPNEGEILVIPFERLKYST
ncbi:MAG: DUF6265 family protein [Pseudomonadota bacterium]